MIQVVVDARIRRGGDDEIDGRSFEALDVARIDGGHGGTWRAVPDARSVFCETLGQLAGFLQEELDGVAARQTARRLLPRGVALRIGHFGQNGGDHEAQDARLLRFGQLRDAVRDAVELEQNVNGIAIALFRPVTHVGFGFALAPLLGDFGDAFGGMQELLQLALRRSATLQPGELDGQRIQIRTECHPAERTRFGDHGAAAAEGIEHARAGFRQTLDQTVRRHGMQPRRIAVKAVHVLHDRVLVGRDVERAPDRALFFFGPTLERDGTAHVAERAALAAAGLPGQWAALLGSPGIALLSAAVLAGPSVRRAVATGPLATGWLALGPLTALGGTLLRHREAAR